MAPTSKAPLDRFVGIHIVMLTSVVALSFLGAILLYQGPFLFWQYALSDLGAAMTKFGGVNTYSRFVFSLGSLIASYLMAKFSHHYFHRKKFARWKLKEALFASASIGFLIFLYPHDVNKSIHSLGGGTVVGASYLLINLLMFEMRSRVSRRQFIAHQFITHASVLSYAVAYFFNLAIKQIPQKFCFLGILYIWDQWALIGLEEKSIFALLKKKTVPDGLKRSRPFPSREQVH